jgi:hypothetical protein
MAEEETLARQLDIERLRLMTKVSSLLQDFEKQTGYIVTAVEVNFTKHVGNKNGRVMGVSIPHNYLIASGN